MADFGLTAKRLVREGALRYHEPLMESLNMARPGSRLPMQRISGLDAEDGRNPNFRRVGAVNYPRRKS